MTLKHKQWRREAKAKILVLLNERQMLIKELAALVDVPPEMVFRTRCNIQKRERCVTVARAKVKVVGNLCSEMRVQGLITAIPVRQVGCIKTSIYGVADSEKAKAMLRCLKS